MEYLLIQLLYGNIINKYVVLKMTTNDIEKAEILLCFKNGEKLLGVTDDEFLLKFIAQFVKFIQIDEVKTVAIPLSEIVKNQQEKQKSYD